MTLRIVSTPSSGNFLERGVYLAPYLSHDGFRVAIAVSRDHRVVDHRVLRAGVDEDAATIELGETLELRDPGPDVRLVG